MTLGLARGSYRLKGKRSSKNEGDDAPKNH